MASDLICRKCGRNTPTGPAECTHCGAILQDPAAARPVAVVIGAIGLVLIVIGVMTLEHDSANAIFVLLGVLALGTGVAGLFRLPPEVTRKEREALSRLGSLVTMVIVLVIIATALRLLWKLFAWAWS